MLFCNKNYLNLISNKQFTDAGFKNLNNFLMQQNKLQRLDLNFR